jgi:chaperone modulatory protein CbpM
MKEATKEVVTGIMIEEADEVTIEEVTRFCSVRREKIIELVMEGIIEPEGRSEDEWRFSGRALSRASKAIRLESDLDVNLPAVAIILDLLDQIDELRAILKRGGR